MKEEWRKYYHDNNADKVIPHSDMKCYGCSTPFSYDERITFINADPYCSDMCFWEKQVVDESWSTVEAPTAEEEAEALIQTFTPDQVEAIKSIAKIFDLKLNI